MGWDAEDAEAAYWASGATRGRPARWGDLVHRPVAMNMISEYPEDEGQERDVAELTREARREALQKRINRTEASLAEARVELAKLDRPVEPKSTITGDAPMIQFRFQFNGYGRVYTFGAVRADGRWYLTGTRSEFRTGRTWDELMDWIEARGTLVGPIRHAIEFRDI